MMAVVVGCPRSPAGVVEGQVVVATVTATIRATPAAVHAVLADGWAYAGWVVGASHVRAVQADWPDAASLQPALSVGFLLTTRPANSSATQPEDPWQRTASRSPADPTTSRSPSNITGRPWPPPTSTSPPHQK